MKYLTIFFLCYYLTGCSGQSNDAISARDLNDSAIAITNHYKDTSKFDQAISLLNRAIKKDSTIFDLYKNKYFFEVTLGDYKSALRTNNRLITFKPDSADLYFQAATLEQFFQDTIQANISFTKASFFYRSTLDTMNLNSPYYLYDWRIWACCMIMTGQESIIHDFLKENCTNSIDSALYNPQTLSKSKHELREVMNNKLRDLRYRR